jgi:uncharacterized protein
MKFTIHAMSRETGQRVRMLYDNETNALTWEDGRDVSEAIPATRPPSALGLGIVEGKESPRTLKISLGLSCNYECEYCSQRFVPRNAETGRDDIASFLSGLDDWVRTEPERIEFWGGEPLVYIKTLRPLAESLRPKYPNAVFSIITNGSLLTPEINEWLDRMGFLVGVSHDGPGQSVRGPDPLDDPRQREAILDLYRRLQPSGRMTFNSMLNRSNTSRSAIIRFFADLTGDPQVQIGEGGVVDAYDEGGVATSLRSSDHQSFRRQAYLDISSGAAAGFDILRTKMMSFINAIRTRRPLSHMGQRCSMDRPDHLAVDLKGNVLTCQNVSAVATSPSGESHRIGHVSDLPGVRLRTATHWSKRDECPKCPVINLCAGACMYLSGPLWEITCDNSYSDNIPVFAAAIEYLSGYVPVRIDGPHRSERHDIWLTEQTQTRPQARRSVIPINVAEAV